ncbi:Hypothetical_protein [Hexamita inflata]|uniref:Hypothetical_protein n=1 Tax=Hexamita inflata TaxID=28002 RepID=A0AA86Q1D5_9EUKA|nr:Hypothetical protein HINF_LOCUS37656 [Hexamita inflata]
MLAFDSFKQYSTLLIQLIHSSHFLPGHDHQNQPNSNHGRLNPPESVSDFVQNLFLLVRFLGVRFVQQFQAQVVSRLSRSQTFLFVGVQIVLAKGEFIKQNRLSRLSQNIIHKYIHISYSFNRFKIYSKSFSQSLLTLEDNNDQERINSDRVIEMKYCSFNCKCSLKDQRIQQGLALVQLVEVITTQLMQMVQWYFSQHIIRLLSFFNYQVRLGHKLNRKSYSTSKHQTYQIIQMVFIQTVY